jgi:hypothetical protein
MKKLLTFGLFLVFLSGCMTKKNLPEHMVKYREQAAETCMQMFSPNDSSSTIIKTIIEYRDTSSKVALNDSMDIDSAEVLPGNMTELTNQLGFNPCDSCFSDTINVETDVAKSSSWVESGKVYNKIENKDSVEIKYKALVIKHEKLEKTYREFERDCIAKEEKIKRIERENIELDLKNKSKRKTIFWLIGVIAALAGLNYLQWKLKLQK